MASESCWWRPVYTKILPYDWSKQDKTSPFETLAQLHVIEIFFQSINADKFLGFRFRFEFKEKLSQKACKYIEHFSAKTMRETWSCKHPRYVSASRKAYKLSKHMSTWSCQVHERTSRKITSSIWFSHFKLAFLEYVINPGIQSKTALSQSFSKDKIGCI